jgi:diacylglycerol kinase (ATP)
MKHTIKFANWLSKWNNFNDILGICILTSVFVVIFVLILSLKRKKLIQSPSALRNYFLRRNNKMLDDEPRHHWVHSDLFAKPTFCNVCESGMMVSGGLCCTYCNLYADVNCLKNAEKKFKCKKLINTKKVQLPNEVAAAAASTSSSLPDSLLTFNKWAHHWIKGNLKLNSVCSICQEDDVGCEPSLNGFKCAWCWRTAHEKCLNCVSTPNLVDECDFGHFGRILLKPNLIFYDTQASISNNAGPLSLANFSLRTTQVSLLHNWTPLIVFANPKSGNNDADVIVKNLTTLLNPLQVNYVA